MDNGIALYLTKGQFLQLTFYYTVGVVTTGVIVYKVAKKGTVMVWNKLYSKEKESEKVEA